MNKRDITISFFIGLGLGTLKGKITIEGEYKFVTRNYILGFILITDTKCYYL